MKEFSCITYLGIDFDTLVNFGIPIFHGLFHNLADWERSLSIDFDWDLREGFDLVAPCSESY